MENFEDPVEGGGTNFSGGQKLRDVDCAWDYQQSVFWSLTVDLGLGCQVRALVQGALDKEWKRGRQPYHHQRLALICPHADKILVPRSRGLIGQGTQCNWLPTMLFTVKSTKHRKERRVKWRQFNFWNYFKVYKLSFVVILMIVLATLAIFPVFSGQAVTQLANLVQASNGVRTYLWNYQESWSILACWFLVPIYL